MSDYVLTRDRFKRQSRAPARGQADQVTYALVTAEKLEYSEPQTSSQAITSSERETWIMAMTKKLQSLEKNKTWILVERQGKLKVVSCKWVFKKKVEMRITEHIKYKARLVARGFTHREGINYN